MATKPTTMAGALPGKNNSAAKAGAGNSNRGMLILLMLVAFFVYANTLSNGYVYDDLSVISKNTIVTKGITAIPELLTTPYRYGFFRTSNDLYRPLSLVMFAAEYQLSDGSPAAGHFMNVLIFVGCVALLFLFLDALFEHKRSAAVFIAALLFALHPVHTEVVANIKSRDELLCFLFGFLSLHTFMRYAQLARIKSLALGCFFFFLSLLAKETSICFLLVFPLVFFCYNNANKRRSLYISMGSVMVAALYLGIRFSVLSAYHANNTFDVKFIDNFLVGAPGAASRMATGLLILGKYLKLLFLPYPLICDYSFHSIPFAGFGDIGVLISLVIYLGMLAAGLYRLFRFPKDPYAFGLLFFLITIALFSNVLFLIGTAMAERFVFFASAGFCLLAGLLLEQLFIKLQPGGRTVNLKDKKALSILIPITAVLAIMTIVRNNDWASSLTLYTTDVQRSPANARLYYLLGNELLIMQAANETDAAAQKRVAADAIDAVKKSLAIYPDYDDAHKVLGNAYYFMAMPDSAELHYKRAIALHADDVEAMNNLDVIYFTAQKYRQSIEVCKLILKTDSSYTERYNNMGICYLRLALYDSAVYVLRQGIAHKNDFNPFYENLALAYKLDNKRDSALKYQGIARQQDAGFTVF